MRKLKLDEWPLGTLLCGGLLVLACAFFGWWSAAQGAVPTSRELPQVANQPLSRDSRSPVATSVALEPSELATR